MEEWLFHKFESNKKELIRTKYRKRPHHKAKEKSEKQLARNAWRVEKQVRRDKAKRQGIVGRCFNDGVPPDLKRRCNKTHRRWEKRCLYYERYDELGGRVHKRRDIFDPWMWF